MHRLLISALLALAAIQLDAAQGSSLLRIKVSTVDADNRQVPLARYRLLVGDSPPSAAPRLAVTTAEGIAEIRLRPGQYTVESDRPATVLGRAYQWSRVVEVVAGRDTTLELTAANADAGSGSAAIEAAPRPVEEITVWTEHRRAAGVVVSGKEAVETSASAIGGATSVEVQLSPTEKVAGRVISTDPVSDVALVQIDRATHLPVESSKPLPHADIRAAAAAGGFSLTPYTSTASDFDVLFITPVLLAKAKNQEGRTGAANARTALRAVTEFGEWSDYVEESAPVFFIRATPKRVESFWTKVARAAAYTQGARIGPITHLGPGFSRMRLLCGTSEIPAIHPFRIRSSVSETEDVDEGFYAFDPMAVGPHCGTVSLVLSSVKDPKKTETAVVPSAVVAQVWNDFAAYRTK